MRDRQADRYRQPTVAAREVAAFIAKIFVVAVIRQGCYASCTEQEIQ
jgi:hypothetical protein